LITSYIQTDDNLEDIAKSFGISFEFLKAANSQIKNSNNIYPGQSLIVPAQAYLVSRGDTLAEIADNVQSTLGSLLALNEIANPDYLLPGYFIRIPARLPNISFAYTVHSGVTLGNLADQYGVLLESLEALKPQISDQDEIFPTEIIRIPSYLPFEGTLIYNDKCYTCNGTATLRKRAKLHAGPKFPMHDKANPRPLAEKPPTASTSLLAKSLLKQMLTFQGYGRMYSK